MITVTSYPSKTISSSGMKSRYHAAFNPIIYNLQRKDYNVLTVTKAGLSDITARTSTLTQILSYIYVTLSTPIGGSDEVTVGDYFYLKCGQYDVVADVLEIVSPTTFKLNVAYKGNASNGFINLNTSRVGYYLETEVLVEQNGSYVVAGKIRSTPDTKGAIEFDPSEWVQDYVDLRNQYLYDGTPNKAEKTSSGIFNLRYTETWQNEEAEANSAIITDSTYQFYMGSVQQVRDTYGQNMALYVPFCSEPQTADSSNVKFLTDFEEPTMFEGYPFDVQFIFSDLIAGYEATRRVREYDKNNVISVAEESEDLDIAGRFYTNRLQLEEPASDSAFIDVEIVCDNSVDAVDRVVPEGYVVTGYWEDIPAGDVIVSPPITF